MAARDKILNYMRRIEKETPGEMKTTREVADGAGISPGTARHILWNLVNSGTLEAADGGASGAMGNPISWRMCSEKHDALCSDNHGPSVPCIIR